MSAMPELPDDIWVDARDFSIHHEGGEFRTRYSRRRPPKEKKAHPHYKRDEDIAAMRALADKGLCQKEIAAKLGIHPRTVRKFVGRVYSAKA